MTCPLTRLLPIPPVFNVPASLTFEKVCEAMSRDRNMHQQLGIRIENGYWPDASDQIIVRHPDELSCRPRQGWVSVDVLCNRLCELKRRTEGMNLPLDCLVQRFNLQSRLLRTGPRPTPCRGGQENSSGWRTMS